MWQVTHFLKSLVHESVPTWLHHPQLLQAVSNLISAHLEAQQWKKKKKELLNHKAVSVSAPPVLCKRHEDPPFRWKNYERHLQLRTERKKDYKLIVVYNLSVSQQIALFMCGHTWWTCGPDDPQSKIFHSSSAAHCPIWEENERIYSRS